MQVAAMTSQAALTASPRLSATIANATAPRRATAIHKSFVCGALELLMVFMNTSRTAGSPTKQIHLRGTLLEAKVYWPETFLFVHTKVSIGLLAATRVPT